MTNAAKSVIFLVSLFACSAWTPTSGKQFTAPVALSVTPVSSNTIILSWTPVSGVTTYTIHVEDTVTGEVKAEVSTTGSSVTISGLNLGHSNGICMLKETGEYVICDTINP